MANKPVRAQVRRIREALDENTGTFGARFAKSGRTVEDWEQGRRVPDALCQRMLDELDNERLQRTVDAVSAAQSAKKAKRTPPTARLTSFSA